MTPSPEVLSQHIPKMVCRGSPLGSDLLTVSSREGLSRFERQVQHRDSGSWCERDDKSLDCEKGSSQSSGSGEWLYSSVGFKISFSG